MLHDVMYIDAVNASLETGFAGDLVCRESEPNRAQISR